MSGAYHNMYIYEKGDEVWIEHVTNDDEDRGYASAFARWTTYHTDLEAAKRHCGVSRTGVSGIRVGVYVNGEKI